MPGEALLIGFLSRWILVWMQWNVPWICDGIQDWEEEGMMCELMVLVLDNGC